MLIVQPALGSLMTDPFCTTTVVSFSYQLKCRFSTVRTGSDEDIFFVEMPHPSSFRISQDLDTTTCAELFFVTLIGIFVTSWFIT